MVCKVHQVQEIHRVYAFSTQFIIPFSAVNVSNLAKFSRAADSVPKGNTLQTITAAFYPIMNACAQAYRSGVRLAKSSGFHDQSEVIPSVFVQSHPHHVWHLLGQRGSTFLLTNVATTTECRWGAK